MINTPREVFAPSLSVLGIGQVETVRTRSHRSTRLHRWTRRNIAETMDERSIVVLAGIVGCGGDAVGDNAAAGGGQ
jgi:hypothetical protein